MITLVIIFFGLNFSQEIPFFDAKRAMDLLNTQCSFGPRFPGSQGHHDFQDSLKTFLDDLVESISFTNVILFVGI